MKKFDVTYDIIDNQKKTLSIIKSSDTIIVRMHQGKAFFPVINNAIKNKAMDYRLVFNIGPVNVYVVHVNGNDNEINKLKDDIAKEKDVRFAGLGFKPVNSADPIIYTENLFIKFKDDNSTIDCENIIKKNHLFIKKKIAFLKNAYFLSVKEDTGDDIFSIVDKIAENKEVENCHPELIHSKANKAIHPNQWHLKKTVVRTETVIDASANVEAAHTITIGNGVTIAIIDDGFDIQHPEFMRAGKVVHPRNYAGSYNDYDPMPAEGDRHGTACAGVACADGYYGASGVAPGAHLMPIRLVEGLGSFGEALSFIWAADNGADIISCSWGPTDGLWYLPNDPRHKTRVELPAFTRLAIDYAVENGRNGKGCVIVFAAGNGNESVENDGYASYDKVIAVAACNDHSTRCIYSDYGQSIWCAFPSGDTASPTEAHPAPLTSGIWTTDLRHQYGYNPGLTLTGDIFGNYTNRFNGTSSSCPGVAGVAALILSANPDLGYADVKTIIRDSCDKIDQESGHYDKNGHSHWYGYGRVNAENAVILAKSWNTEVRGVV
ncbi:S8 family serine peptidase [Yersinia ruckeri]|uniref:S8 family peptidase n=1 Tax=Yersinia ruckeri TaxID=29486 RepID=UPI001F3A9DB3|nr:S8 family serine peptidase [Yersinia ruckeri]ELM3741174.1 S8 family serine peptidase [Yersinia ruckeri]MCK8543373.1 S8 family serine peptidase [Yersinia ruckeri]MCK8552834.1 S8 family serine peptidase [Yersinia ruckeri]MCW6519425.1 S8 family serine peptidase [Yersinia ruckeri]MCW6540814.1 S8 family serine peptidase [Yersinia ruckeri]